MKELTIEEKAKRYDEVSKEVKDYFEGRQKMYSDVTQTLEYLFPELKESEDERIRKWIIENIQETLDVDGFFEGQKTMAKNAIAYLEKQGEHAKFCDSIQVGDKVTRNEDGVLVNLSQLNRVAKRDEKQGEQKPAWSEEDKVMLDKVIERLHKHSAGDKEYLDIYYWLIALKDRVQPQPKQEWKPSEEQINALSKVLQYYGDVNQNAHNVKKLLEQLKAL